MSTSTLLHSLFRQKAAINPRFFDSLEKIDPTKYADDLKAAIRLMNHIYVVDRVFAARLAGTSHPYTASNTPETPALSELRAAFLVSDAWYVDYIARLPAAALTEEISFRFTDDQGGSMSREEILAHVATHGSNHRGAVGRILELCEVSRPKDILTGFLHQTEPARREKTIA